jgi:hypothetical protein
MLKGSVLLFTYLITIFYVGKKFTMEKHLYMVVILLSLAVIGTSNMGSEDIKNVKCKK